MTRIFPMLASFSLMLMGVAATLGLVIGDLYADPVTQTTLDWRGRHMMTGVAAALFVVLVESIAVTYFVGTSRWCKEVCETYHLDPMLIRRSTMLKRRTFPWAVMGMLAVVGVIALGAAADPATGLPQTRSWITPHLLGALAGIAFIGWTFYVAWRNIAANHRVIADVLEEVRQIRMERGLEV